jgi:hypothetical protein
MKRIQLVTLRFFALLFLLPGLGGLILSAVVSTNYLDTMPRLPAPEEQRVVPRSVHGVIIYQTPDEDKRLSTIEDASVAVFVLGLGLSVWYLEQWSSFRARESEEEELSESASYPQ